MPAGHYQLPSGDLDLGGTHNKYCGRPQTDMVIVGAGRRTVIDGAGADRVFDAHRGRFLIGSLVVTGGHSVEGGGGIRVNAYACLAAAQLTVIRNKAGGAGGGIFSGKVPTSTYETRRSSLTRLVGTVAGSSSMAATRLEKQHAP